MKHYKLLKDLLTFNAGDRFVLKDDGCLYLNEAERPSRHWQSEVMAYHRKTLEYFPNILKDWFEPVQAVEEWEPKSTILTKCGLEVASENYYEILGDGTKKTAFTWNEAMEIEEKTNGKWRLPTVFEWGRLLEELGSKGNTIDRDAFVKTLNLAESKNSHGYYWSASPSPLDTYRAYTLYFNNSCVLQDSNLRYVDVFVRLVRGKEEKR